MAYFIKIFFKSIQITYSISPAIRSKFTLLKGSKKMMEKRFGVLLCIALCIFLIGLGKVFAEQIPKSQKEIPQFSGAVRDSKEEVSMKEQMGWIDNPDLRSADLNIYKTNASPEEVFGFYLKKIGGKEGVPDVNPEALTPGSVSQVWYEIEYYTDEDFEDTAIDAGEYAEARNPGTWMKQNLTKNRKPYKPGKWIKEARFNWLKKEPNNDLTEFYLIIFDNSFEFAPEKYKTATTIESQVTTTKSSEAMREEDFEKIEREAEAKSKSLARKPPTEKDLGVPIYPGAAFDAQSSAGMSLGEDFAIYIYLSNDPPSKVASFYEGKLKIKPVSMGKDQYMFALKGNMPMPDEGLVIQPNTMFGGSAKTVISIQKMVSD